MKRLVTIFLAVLGFSLTAEAQISVDKQLGALDAEQTKARINQIKRDSCYLYGEGTMPTKEEADELAMNNLVANIEEWCATQPGGDAPNMVGSSVLRGYPMMSTMRGNMYRSFAYAHKSEILPSYAATTETPAEEPAPAPAPAEEGAVAPVVEAAPTVEAAPATTLTAEEQAALAELNISEGAAATIAAATGTAPSAVATETAASTAVAPVVEPAPASIAEPAPAPAPVVVAEPEPAPAPSFPMNELVALKTIDEVKQFLGNHGDTCAHGDVTRSMDLEMVGQAMLIVYNISDGKVRTILDKKQENGKRVNYFSRYEDSTRNYKGCGAWWVLITR